jgi:hypothetical protein
MDKSNKSYEEEVSEIEKIVYNTARKTGDFPYEFIAYFTRGVSVEEASRETKTELEYVRNLYLAFYKILEDLKINLPDKDDKRLD